MYFPDISRQDEVVAALGLRGVPIMAAQLQVLLMGSVLLQQAAAKLVLPATPPRGFNSFDLQSDNKPWNETVFRATAHA
jgi:hypothetical protein